MRGCYCGMESTARMLYFLVNIQRKTTGFIGGGRYRLLSKIPSKTDSLSINNIFLLPARAVVGK